jgi:hypothetical protein
MNMNENRDWLIRKAKQEDGCFVSVGGLVDAMEQAEHQTSSNAIPFKRLCPFSPTCSSESEALVGAIRKEG